MGLANSLFGKTAPGKEQVSNGQDVDFNALPAQAEHNPEQQGFGMQPPPPPPLPPQPHQPMFRPDTELEDSLDIKFSMRVKSKNQYLEILGFMQAMVEGYGTGSLNYSVTKDIPTQGVVDDNDTEPTNPDTTTTPEKTPEPCETDETPKKTKK